VLHELWRILVDRKFDLRHSIRQCYREEEKVHSKKKQFCRSMREVEWDEKYPFELDPIKFIGGSTQRWAEKREDQLSWLRWRLNQFLTQRYGLINQDTWAKKVIFEYADIDDF